ncbi:uncharacterized protein LOC122059320 [Macadamia integrifolia]|uniref:uncharacterized protein LOC122059320 n=1 Tax=Macadamia integrifolia TaxID=60698 RepID=UPI001C501F41|nr:uncharacterized protein LOC122059320 [Macadamia integrifolia]
METTKVGGHIIVDDFQILSKDWELQGHLCKLRSIKMWLVEAPKASFPTMSQIEDPPTVAVSLRVHVGNFKSGPGASHANDTRYRSTLQHVQERVKNVGHKRKTRFASWNIGSLTGKSLELIDVMRRRRINIACIQETRWKGMKAKMLDDFKLWYLGDQSGRDGVGIVVDKDLKNDVVDVKRVGDRIISLKLVLDKEVKIISVYAPQAGLDESYKLQFWEHMDELMYSFKSDEKIIMGDDLNGHIGKDMRGYVEVHGGYGVGERNEEGTSILDFTTTYDLFIANTLFIKREEHSISYKNGQHSSQIDFFLTRRPDRWMCKVCKVIPEESLTSQHRC